MRRDGVSLIEVVVSIVMISFILAAFTASFSSIPLSQKNKHSQQAYNLAAQQIETIKSVPFNDLANQTDGPFRFVGYPVGSILVKQDAASYSGSHILEISNATNAVPFSSLALLPQNRYDDFTFTAQIKIKNSPPAGWQAGQALRYQDTRNYYWLYLDASGLKFSKLINGTITNLFSQALSLNTENWYELKTVAVGSVWQIYFNNLLLATINDTSISYGLLGLAATQGASGQFDDLSVLGANPGTWNFETDAAGSLPTGWQRFSLSDLPNGAGLLTIENYLNSNKLKKVTVKVSWLEKSSNPEIKLVTLITND